MLAAAVSVLGLRIQAQESESLCNEARGLTQKENSPWLGRDTTGKLVAIKPGIAQSKKALDSLVYFHTRRDRSSRSTIIAAKLIFQTQGNSIDKKWIRAKSNFKKKPISVSYENYQDYHNGVREDFEVKTNFHLTKGLFNSRIPFSTFEPAERRRQLAFPQEGTSDELTYRTYLMTFQGVRTDGSCVTFQPFFPNGTMQTEVEIIDLLPDVDSDMFYRPSIKFGLSD
jgi:hypothetical protein